jgi:hypothetical protein
MVWARVLRNGQYNFIYSHISGIEQEFGGAVTLCASGFAC